MGGREVARLLGKTGRTLDAGAELVLGVRFLLILSPAIGLCWSAFRATRQRALALWLPDLPQDTALDSTTSAGDRPYHLSARVNSARETVVAARCSQVRHSAFLPKESMVLA